MRNIQPKNQSTWPAKVLSMHTESLTVRTERMILFLRSGSYYTFFIFQLCKIVWGNYVPLLYLSTSWENPRGHLQTQCANNKGADQLRSLINAFVVRYLESMIT